MEGLTVSLSPDGVPDAFTVAGDSWRVVEEPVRWFERTPWWETETRMQRDHGRIDVEVWQLLAMTAGETSHLVCADSTADLGNP